MQAASNLPNAVLPKQLIVTSCDRSVEIAITGSVFTVTIDAVHAFIFRNGTIVDAVLTETHDTHTETTDIEHCPGCQPFLRAVQS